MKYTPLDVRHQEFPTGMNGYRRAEVRNFLTELATQLETRLQEQQALNERILELEGQLHEFQQSEEDLRRAVIGAERIAGELRENARREAELISAQAEVYRDGVTQQANARSAALEARHEARTTELETLHRARGTELEAAMASRSTQLEASYNARFSDLEALYHRRHRELEQNLSGRTAHLEAVFSHRHNELSNLLSRAREEQAQFVAQYRALVGSFYELSQRHLMPDAAPLPLERPSPSHSAGLPPAIPDPFGSALALGQGAPDEPAHTSSETDTSTPAVEEQQFV
ncbi:DivIVA domain-containing protein [Deinococcus sp.]|uniref:DivIVA domain-containing protein n=1 Tax=Deinococcus sp. TaxID=47478 RepID=UPI003CC69FCF